MAEDVQTLREVWDGKIPVCFVLAADEECSVEKPELFYLVLSRQTYFPVVTEKVQRHFLKYIDSEQQEGEMWFDDDGVPIRWHYPIGVLFDLASRQTRLPWTLTVHFRNFPETDLLHCPSKDAVESHFISMIKEADFLKHRGTVINGMTKKDHKQLWQGLVSDRFDHFWAVNRKLMEQKSSEQFRFVPFRIHRPEQPFVQVLFQPTSATGNPNTLRDLLNHTLRDFDNWNGDEHNFSVVIQGVEPMFDTPIQWLSEHLSHPDNFLHICILPK